MTTKRIPPPVSSISSIMPAEEWPDSTFEKRTPFEKLIEKIRHRGWRVTIGNCIRDSGNNCPLGALSDEIGDYMACSTAFQDIGGSERQAWIIMSAADNLITDPFGDDGTFSKPKRSEVKAMRDRLIGALMPKLEAI